MTEDLHAVLEQVQRERTPQNLANLMRVYVTPELTDEDRAFIRLGVAGDPGLVEAMLVWAEQTPKSDPERYVRLRLLVFAMVDGRPDTHETGLQIEELVKWAHRNKIDPGPHISAVQMVSSTTMATIMHHRALAWKRTRRFVEGQITVLLETLKRSPGDEETLESLAAMYVHPDTTEEQRRSIRNLVQTKPLLIERFNKFKPSKRQEEPERYFRLMLAAISITDARPDWQETGRRLMELRKFARMNGVDAQVHIDYVCKISTPRTEQVLRRQRM